MTAIRSIRLKNWQAHRSIDGVVAAERGCLKPAGEWNEETVVVRRHAGEGGRERQEPSSTPTPRPSANRPARARQARPIPGLPARRAVSGFSAAVAKYHFRNIRIPRTDELTNERRSCRRCVISLLFLEGFP